MPDGHFPINLIILMQNLFMNKAEKLHLKGDDASSSRRIQSRLQSSLDKQVAIGFNIT